MKTGLSTRQSEFASAGVCNFAGRNIVKVSERSTIAEENENAGSLLLDRLACAKDTQQRQGSNGNRGGWLRPLNPAGVAWP